MPRAPTVLVVGAGHAGLEAAFAAARVGARVHVVTGKVASCGLTPCNPSIGGVAKGHLVAEVEALGGFMGRAADACAIHGRVLNRSKGPAVRATRVQVDKARYGAHARAALTSHPTIEVTEALVSALVTRGGRVCGVRLSDGATVPANAVVLTTGTFLGGVLHTGHDARPGGRLGEAPATALAEHLRALGFRLVRLKTGTPPRLRARSIDWGALELQPGEDPPPRFTLPGEPAPPRLPQVPCHLTWTCEQTHDLIREHLSDSAMYGGRIVGRGPRYCPSVEDKVVRFPDRARHQVFLEPEGLNDPLVYPNGISTSLPADVQVELVRTIPGLARAEVVVPGYAVEYDAVDARALDHTLACLDLSGLYCAGQLNGTSGYEEAAAQGLVAGANAALAACGRPPLLVERHEGYVGVLVDDLVTQGCDEPYRMFTARAEYRIALREDNADARLEDKAHAAGLIDDERHARGRSRRARVDAAVARMAAGDDPSDEPTWVLARARARRTYAGYLDKVEREIRRARGLAGSDLPIPADLDYFALPGLQREAAERLSAARPRSTAQAGRVPGLTPAALSCLWAHVRRRALAAAAAPT